MPGDLEIWQVIKMSGKDYICVYSQAATRHKGIIKGLRIREMTIPKDGI